MGAREKVALSFDFTPDIQLSLSAEAASPRPYSLRPLECSRHIEALWSRVSEYPSKTRLDGSPESWFTPALDSRVSIRLGVTATGESAPKRRLYQCGDGPIGQSGAASLQVCLASEPKAGREWNTMPDRQRGSGRTETTTAKAGAVSEQPRISPLAGEYIRSPSVFREWITRDGASGLPAEPNRYHLYLCLACPWSHRVAIFRSLKRLEDVLGLTVLDPVRDERGWRFGEGQYGEPDPINGFRLLSEAYVATDPEYAGRITSPVIWDTVEGRIVNNESSETIRMLNSEFDAWADASVDFYPEELRDEIDEVNERVYETVNNGVYRAGFATSQQAYEDAFEQLFETLDWLDARLGSQRYLVGNLLTEADWRLFVTLLRFDTVYYSHFKCNRTRIVDFPHLWDYTRDLYQHPGIAETANMDHIKRHYFMTHLGLNPTRIVPKGPDLDFAAPHIRSAL